jgi:hypothetical protein
MILFGDLPFNYTSVPVLYTYGIRVSTNETEVLDEIENKILSAVADGVQKYYGKSGNLTASDPNGTGHVESGFGISEGLTGNDTDVTERQTMHVFGVSKNPPDKTDGSSCATANGGCIVDGEMTVFVTGDGSGSNFTELQCEIVEIIRNRMDDNLSSVIEGLENITFVGDSGLNCSSDNTRGVVGILSGQTAQESGGIGLGGILGIIVAAVLLLLLMLLVSRDRKRRSECTGEMVESVASKDLDGKDLFVLDKASSIDLNADGGATLCADDFTTLATNRGDLEADGGMNSDTNQGWRNGDYEGSSMFPNLEAETTVNVHRCQSSTCADCLRSDGLTIIKVDTSKKNQHPGEWKPMTSIPEDTLEI